MEFLVKWHVANEDLDIKNIDSMGMTLVRAFVKQLVGESVINRENGTEFIVRFNAKN